jgi:hypothetical protein
MYNERGRTTLLNGQSHFTLDRIGGADANMSFDVIFNSVFYIEWDVRYIPIGELCVWL